VIPKPIDVVQKPDIDSLLANKVAEGRTIDYKLQLPGTTDDAKKEFLADVSSFANASGGDLLFGASETAGVPTALPGLSAPDLDAEILRLESIIRDGIQPRVPVRCHKVEGFTAGPVLVIRVPQSWAAPHMVTFKTWSRFFTRNSAGKYQMDVGELRSAFAASESLGERLQSFRTERLGRIIADETPTPINAPAKMVLHIMPFSSFTLGTYIDPQSQRNLLHLMFPLGRGSFDYRFNLDGFLTYRKAMPDNGIPGTYCQLFRSGAIEGVSADVFNFKYERGILDAPTYESYLIQAVPNYLAALKQVQVPTPMLLTLSMTGVRHFALAGRMGRFGSGSIDRDVLLLPDVRVEQYDADAPSLLRPIFDAVWNAAGFERCFNYNSSGEWKSQD
jgi:hypothetical protein